MSEDPVLLDLTREGVAVVTLNRPEAQNAFNAALVEQLDGILQDLATADGVRVVLLDAKGDSFSSGADADWIWEAVSFTEQDYREEFETLARMLRRLRELPKPTIALVQGPATVVGVGLIAACDVAIAVRKSSFRIAQVRIGMIPATVAPLIAEAIGLRNARRYFLSAESFDAEQAKAIGLVHEVVDDRDALAEAAERLVGEFFANAPGAVAAAKALIDEIAGATMDDALIALTARACADQRESAEAKEGIAALVAQRRPSWAR